jgi:DNA helicase-4
LPRESLKGDYVKSFGEKVIANTLFQHAVDYKYERNFRWDGTNYRPGFTILLGPKRGVVIEYFGLEGDADYDSMSAKKRDFWARCPGWTLVELTPDDLRSRGADG